MKKEKQVQIANSFSKLNVESKLDITISDKEFQILKNGISAKSMDEKWNIFVLKNNIYFSRSWTNYCIYKVRYKIEKQSCHLNQIFITRDSNQYRSKSLEHDLNMFKRLLQMYLQREDLFIDERLQLDLIKKTIEKFDRWRYLSEVSPSILKALPLIETRGLVNARHYLGEVSPAGTCCAELKIL